MRKYLMWAFLFIASTAQAQEPAVRPMQQSDSYAYSADALRSILDDPAVFDFQLELAWGADDTLQGRLVAVDADQQMLGVVYGTFADRAIDVSRLMAMADITAEELDAQPPALATHILHPRVAGAFIADWAALRHSGAPLADALSHDSQALLLHGIDKAMIVDIVTRAEAAELVVFWGLNSAGKLTPVLMGIDQDDAEMVGSVAAAGFAMDFTKPCPSICGGKAVKAGPPGGLTP